MKEIAKIIPKQIQLSLIRCKNCQGYENVSIKENRNKLNVYCGNCSETSKYNYDKNIGIIKNNMLIYALLT